ncbi:hypothetical protein [Kitasatospora sp. NPDC087314]|uniref:hypothetical protein n=1 Tax=Kitasatospora sp. NPDC087314 TaxID=3364068 RepID=UPI0037F3551E
MHKTVTAWWRTDPAADRWAEPTMVLRWQGRALKLGWPTEQETITRNGEVNAIVTHPEVAILANALAPLALAPSEFFTTENESDIRAFVDRTTTTLGLDPLSTAIDAIRNYTDQVRLTRGRHRWRQSRSAMIPELGIPDPSHQTWRAAAQHNRVRHDQ